MIVAGILLSLLPQAAAPSGDEIRAKVERVMAERFQGLPSDRRVRYTEALISSLSAVASDPRRSALLQELPAIADYCATRAEGHRIVAPKLTLDPATQLEGHELQACYLSALVARAAAVDWTEQTRGEAIRQIEAICAVAKSTLSEKLRGDGAADLIDETLDQHRKEWVATLEFPFGCYIDRPLTAVQLESVLAGIRSALSGVPMVEIPQIQAQDSRVAALFQKVDEACWKATAVCFAELEGLEQRSQEFQAKVDHRAASHFRESGAAYVEDARAGLPRAKELKQPGKGAAESRKDPQEPDVTNPPRPREPESRVVTSRAAALVLILVGGLVVFARSRRKGRETTKAS